MDKFDIDEILASLSVRARAAGDMLDIREISALAEYDDASENDIKELLSLLGSEGISFCCDGNSFGKDRIKQLTNEIRESCEEERAAAAGRSEDTVRMYLREISALEPSDAHREHELVLSMLEGDEDAAEGLVEDAMYIPVLTAMKHLGRGMLFLDLVQEGNLALMAAAQEITDPAISFSAFCAFRLERLMTELTGGEDQPLMKIPGAAAEDLARVIEEEKKLDSSLVEKEKLSALSAALKLDEKRIAGLLELEKELLTARKTDGQDAESPVEAEENEADKFLSRQVGEMLASLSQMEARVISMRFGIGEKGELSYEDIAGRLGITAVEAEEIEKQAMLHLGRQNY